jgi:hypothetical protein
MPSLYNQDSGNGVLFGQNSRKVKPTTQFGTRQYHRWTVYTEEDITVNYLETNSLYSQIVRSLQQGVELYGVFTPAPTFFTCILPYAFQIDVAMDTSHDLWTAENSFITDGDPTDWYYGNDAGTDAGTYNPNAKILIDLVGDALNSAGANTNCWVDLTYTVGDMTWPIDIGGGAPPGAVINAPQSRSEYIAKVGDSKTTRLAKLANWLKTL